MGWESSGVVRFDLGPLLQGQTRIAKLKRGVWSDLTLDSSFQVKIAKLKNAYNYYWS